MSPIFRAHRTQFPSFLLPLALLVVVSAPAENRSSRLDSAETISGDVAFTSLDGSSEDGDGLADGLWTVPNGLVLDGRLGCGVEGASDSGRSGRPDCTIAVRVEGDLILQPGSGIEAGRGLTLEVDGDLRIGEGSFLVADGPLDLTAAGEIAIDGLVSATGAAAAAGKTSAASVRIASTAGPGYGIRVGASGTVLSAAGTRAGSRVELSGCGLEILGSVASVDTGSGAGRAGVVLRSCEGLVVDGADLHDPNGVRRGRIEVQGAGASVIDLLAKRSITLDGAELRAIGGEASRIAVTSAQGSLSWRLGLGEVDPAGEVLLKACEGVDLDASRIAPLAVVIEACDGVRKRDPGTDPVLRPAELTPATLAPTTSPLPLTCTPNLAVDNLIISTTEEYTSCQVLTSENTRIISPGFVTYRAGDSILLGNGFSVEGASTFIAIIDSALNHPPEITSDGGGAAAAVNAAENQTAATDVDSTDPEGETEGAGLTYAITGGSDSGLFSIDLNTGVLIFGAAPDFETKADDNADGIYEVEVTVADSEGGTDVQVIMVTVTNVNEAPTITSNGAGATAAVNAAEEQTAVTDVQAADPDGETEGAGLTYSITGGADELLFSIDINTGEVAFNTAPDFENPGDSDTDNVYEVEVTTTDSGSLTDVQLINTTVTEVNEAPLLATGALNFIDAEFHGVDGVDGLFGATSEAVSPDGKHVYVTGQLHNALAVFSRNEVTGKLIYLEVHKDGAGGVDGLLGATSEAVSPDGKHVYVTGRDDHAIAVFSRDPTTGALQFVESQKNWENGVTGLYGAYAVTTSPDGLYVYATGYYAHALVAFKRNPLTGRLTFSQVVRFNDSGVNGLVRANSVAVSPDGDHLYVTSQGDDTVAVFSRDSTTGILSFVESHSDGVNGVDGLAFATSVAVSPDGAHVYATGVNDRAIAVFSRAAGDGTLAFVEVLKDLENGVDGLDGGISIAVGPDGRYVYVASYYEDAVTTFSREPTTGCLTFVELQQGNAGVPGGLEGLDGAYSVTVSPDGRHIYSTSYLDNGVSVLGREDAAGVFFVGGGQVPLIDGTSDLRVIDVDSTSLLSATVTILNLFDPPNEILAVNTSGTAISAAYAPATGTLSLTGSDTLANYQQVLRTLTYENTVAVPNSTTRQVTILGNDGSLDSNVLTALLTLRFPPAIISDGGGPTAALDAPESQTAVTDMQAADPDGDSEGSGLTYSITGGADSTKFSIVSSTGVLRFLTAPDFDNPTDFDSGNDYAVQVTITDSDGLTDAQDISVSVTDLIGQPEITSDGGGPTATLNVAENQTAVTDVQSTDPDGDTEGVGLVYSILDNPDAAKFSIVGATGVLTFLVSPDFESPGDANSDNDYEVQVAVIDSSGLKDVQDITVTVIDANDAPLLAAGSLKFVEAQFNGANGVDGLDGAVSVAVSPDGLHLYAAGRDNNSIAVFSRGAVSGELTFVEFQMDETAGVDGLGGVRSVTLSPDGQHLYSTGTSDNAVAVFGRDPASGELTFVDVETNGVDGVDGLGGVYSAVVSPDGLHLYAVGRSDDAIAVFGRDPASGKLTFVESHRDRVNGVFRLGGPESIIVSPDGKHVYTANYISDSVGVFSRDAGSGKLTFVEYQLDGLNGVDGLNGATSVTVSPNGLHVYVGARREFTVAVFSRNFATGELSFVGFENTGKANLSVAVSPNGNNVYSAASSSLIAFSRDDVTGAITHLENLVDGFGGVDGLGGATDVTVTCDGRHVYSAGASDDAVAVFSRQDTTATFSLGGGPVAVLDPSTDFTVTDIDDTNLELATVTITNLLDAPSEILAVNTGGTSIAAVYTAATGVLSLTGSDTLANYQQVLSTLSYDNTVVTDMTTRLVEVVANDGDLDSNTFTAMVRIPNPPEIISDGGGPTAAINVPENQTAVTDVQSTDPEGDTEGAGLTYTLTGGADQAKFSIVWRTGVLTFLVAPDLESPGDANTDNAYEVQVTVTDTDLAKDNQDITVTVTDVNEAPEIASDGALRFIEAEFDGTGGVDGLDSALSVAVSPDGQHVYAAGSSDDALAVFSRNVATGELTFVQFKKDGVDGVDGLDGASSVAVSPDGNHVYATSFTDHAVAVFSRNAATGKLTFVEIQKDGVGGVDGLLGALSVTVSPDGEHVYAAGHSDDAVAVFSRNAVTGELAYVEVQKDGVGGVDGLRDAYSVAVSPDGNHVYAAGSSDDAVAVFSRDTVTGELAYVEVQKDGVGGVDGLRGASSVTVSPDGLHVYAAGSSDDAVAVFSRNANTGDLTFVEIQRDGVGGVDGLDSARSVTMSPDGLQVYAAARGYSENSVAAFSRNTASGELTFVEVRKDGVGGVDGLNGAYSVTVSPDGQNAYAAGSSDDAVAVFSRQDTTATFLTGGGPVAILNPHTGFTVTDPDDVNLESATATITNLLDAPNEILAVDTGGTSIAAAYTPATGVLSLTGSDTLANYQQVLRTLTYDNTVVTDMTTRLVEVVANDGDLDSSTFTATVRLLNPPP